MNKSAKQLIIVASITTATLGATPFANAFGLGDAVNIVRDGANQASDTVHDAGQEIHNAANQGAQTITDALGNPVQGGSVQVDLPNPVQYAAGQMNDMRDQAGNAAGRARREVGRVYNEMENAPGINVRGGGGIEVNGRQVAGEGNLHLNNPLRDMRRGVEDGLNRTGEMADHMRDNGGRIGRRIVRETQNRYNDMENAPGFSAGGGAEVEVNGRRYGHHDTVNVPNPLRDIRQGFENAGADAQQHVRQGADAAGRAWSDVYNAPGVSMRAGGRWNSRDNGVDVNANAGFNPYQGQDPRLSGTVERGSGNRTVQVMPRMQDSYYSSRPVSQGDSYQSRQMRNGGQLARTFAGALPGTGGGFGQFLNGGGFGGRNGGLRFGR